MSKRVPFVPLAVLVGSLMGWASPGMAGVSGVGWPGAGAGQPNPSAGYPPVYFWKEEGVVGNNHINVMVDQNGTIYDVQYPGAGGVFGVGTRNEGYNGGFDTFPPFTTGRGQMHVNQYMAGIRVVGQGPTHWYSNPNGVSYTQVSQAYHPTSQTITTTRRLITGGANLFITQHDFSPKLSSTPYPAFNDGGLRQNRMLHVQRHIIRNDGAAGAPIEFFFYGDWALNGGDGFDGAYDDTAIINGQTAHAMIAFDNAGGSANSRGEYNPTTFSDYPKNVSLFLGAALKVAPSVGAGGGSFAPETWRTLGSSDNGQGWIAAPVALNPGQSVEIDVLIVGGYKDSAGVANVGDVQIRPALAWFQSNSMAALQAETDAWWTDWLDSGTTVDTPDNRYDDLFRRGLLCSALHVDGGTPFSATGGAIIAGFHNGAYPYSWPRDAVYAAVMFARTGHFAESAGAYTWMRDVAFRDNEPWGKGFWKQKYTTDGYTVWGAPQIDETAVFPWGVKWHYDATGDLGFVGSMYPAIRDAALTMSSSPSNPAELPRLNFNPSVNLMYSNNVWEDQYDFFIYSNASVHRGLEDARSLAATLGNAADAADFAARRDTIKSGLDARVDANAELTDISQLGIVYPFEVYSPVDPRSVRYIDRVNGVANDSSGNSHPLVRFDTPLNQANGWVGLIDRYWGDTYWNGGPWFLTTLWYGLYYAERADFTPGKGDIDNHKSRIDLLIPKLGPMGLGAEQIAPLSPASGPGSSLLYANQPDFTLQTAWPNAWESMSTLVDSIMAFLDYRPDAPANTMRLAPKLPSDWSTITYRNIAMGAHRVSLTLSETSNTQSALFTNNTGAPVNAAAVLKIPPGRSPCSVTLNGSPISYAFDRQTGRVNLFTRPLATGPSATTELRVQHRAGRSGDFNQSGAITIQDLFDFLAAYFAMDPATDVNESGTLSVQDLFDFMAIYFAGCA